LFSRTQLKQEWIKAMGDTITAALPKKLLEKAANVISPA
jgi:hypothetical protein